MKKGLIVALMTVSIASAMVSRSHASAPVIRDFPDIIIGDEAVSLATSAQTFVFPDALDLRTYFISDNDSTSLTVQWSFIDAAGHIQINGLDSTGNPTTPGASSLTASDLDPLQVDGDPFTITFRNKYFSPIGGPNNEHGLSAFTDPLTSVSTIDTNVITLFASDTATYSQKNLTVYTVNNTSDGLSGGVTFTAEQLPDFSAGNAQGWTGLYPFPSQAGGTFQVVSGSGLCLVTAGGGLQANAGVDNSSQWLSPEQYVPLKDNTLYRVRAHMNTTQTTAGQIPFWRIGYINNQTTMTAVNQNYGGQRFYLSASGGASGIGTPNGRTVFESWWAPNAMSTPSWRDPSTGELAPSHAGQTDFLIDFTMFDDKAQINSNADWGTICLSSVTVDSVPAASLIGSGTLVYNAPVDGTNYTLTTATTGPNTSSFTGNGAEITVYKPNSVNPGDVGAAPGVALLPVGNPILWESNVLYGTEADLTDSIAGAADPVGFVITGYSVPSTEQVGDDYTWRGNAGYMTKVGSPTNTASTYRTWWYSNNVTTVGDPHWAPFVQLFNKQALNNNKGGDNTIISALRVNKYTVPVYPN